MPRSIELSINSDLADAVIERLQGVDGVVGLARQRGVSISRPGDHVVVITTNDASRAVFDLLPTGESGNPDRS